MAQDPLFKVEVKGMKELQRLFQESPEIAEPIMQNAIRKGAEILADHTDQNTVPFKTGNLIRSFQPVEIGKLFARWYPRAEYAKILQFGGRTAPHVILPKKGGALWWPGLAHPVKKVNHPGSTIQARNYMEKILDASRSQINGTFKQALDTITKAIANQ